MQNMSFMQLLQSQITQDEQRYRLLEDRYEKLRERYDELRDQKGYLEMRLGTIEGGGSHGGFQSGHGHSLQRDFQSSPMVMSPGARHRELNSR